MMTMDLWQKKQRAAEESKRREEDKRARSGAARDARLTAIYGKTRDQMVISYHSRVSAALASVSRDELELHEHVGPLQIAFRKRQPDKELGKSSLKLGAYRPRRVLRGGGLLDAGATAALPKHDDTPPVLDHGAYQPPSDLELRERHREKEISGPLRWGSTSDKERIADALAAAPALAKEPWQPLVSCPVWRTETPERWQGGAFRLRTAPSDLASRSLTGKPYFPPLCAHERYVDPTKIALRDSSPEKRLAGDFCSAVPLDVILKPEAERKRAKRAKRRRRPRKAVYNNSLRGLRTLRVQSRRAGRTARASTAPHTTTDAAAAAAAAAPAASRPRFRIS